MAEQVRAQNTKSTLLRLWTYLRRQRRRLVMVAVLVVLTTGLAVTGPYLMGRAIDDEIIPGDMTGLTRIALLMLAIYAMQSLLTWASGWLMVGVGQQTVLDLRNDLFTRLQSLPLKFFDQRPHG